MCSNSHQRPQSEHIGRDRIQNTQQSKRHKHVYRRHNPFAQVIVVLGLRLNAQQQAGRAQTRNRQDNERNIHI